MTNEKSDVADNTLPPLNEYPRPQLVRKNWMNLNGEWDYAITDNPKEPDEFDGKITVPFSPETALSGVKRALQPKQTLWYHREVELPEHSEDERIVLHFGAVDQYCRIFVDRKLLVEHTGGYWPFDVELPISTNARVDIIVAVQDSTDTGDEAYGKQSLDPKSGWYTGTSGIWQTVWLEVVPNTYITGLIITPDVPGESVRVHIALNKETRVETRVLIKDGETIIAETHGTAHAFTLPLPEPHLWSPDDPFRYGLTVFAGSDSVESYFGMRQVSRGRDEHDRAEFLLNDEAIFQSGVIDAGVWPESGMTPPSAQAMRDELLRIKSLGFNMVRKQAKIEPLRWYALCDEIGLLVWQDFVSGGRHVRQNRLRLQKFLTKSVNDHDYKTFGRLSSRGRENFIRDAERTIDLLQNSPAVVVWTPFNAGCGQFDALRIANLVRQRDSSRLIDHAAGGFDQGGGDFRSVQSLQLLTHLKRDKIGRIQALTAIGNESLETDEGRLPIKKRLLAHRNAQSLSQAIRHLYTKDLQPLVPAGLAVVVYNQLTDNETAANGLQDAERNLKVDPKLISGLNALLFSAFKLPPK